MVGKIHILSLFIVPENTRSITINCYRISNNKRYFLADKILKLSKLKQSFISSYKGNSWKMKAIFDFALGLDPR